MPNQDDVDPLARVAYRHGRDTIDWAIHLAKNEIEVRETILAARAEDPNAFPGYVLELTHEAVARRIVGNLLDAGWKPPDWTEEP